MGVFDNVDDIMAENGVLSFENPNYVIGHTFDSTSSNNINNLNNNCNSSTASDGGAATAAATGKYSSLGVEEELVEGLAALDHLCHSLDELTRSASQRRRRYAELQPASMGVNLHQGPVTSQRLDHQNNPINSSVTDEELQQTTGATATTTVGEEQETTTGLQQGYSHDNNNSAENNMGLKDNNSINNNKNNPDLIEDILAADYKLSIDRNDENKDNKQEKENKNNETDVGVTMQHEQAEEQKNAPSGGVPHMRAGDTQDLYALPMKTVGGDSRGGGGGGGDGGGSSSSAEEDDEEEEAKEQHNEELPPGWEKHEDNDGPYYWHIKSGTITRTAPSASTSTTATRQPPTRRNKEDQVGVPRSTTSSGLAELAELRPRSTNTAENAYKRRSYPVRSELSETSRAIRFAVRSLGWLEVAEEDLTPERSSKAVNRCIVDLSMGRRDVMDVVGCWGEGKDLFMDLDEGSLKLVDPENLTLLNSQPIHTIRVWGVGRDNGRDFAYVARDRVSRKHMCHVFRCDTPARTIANTLRDICKKIMIERSLNQATGSSFGSNSSLLSNNGGGGGGGGVMVGTGGGGGGGSLLGNRSTSRPSNLPMDHRRPHRHSPLMCGQSSFPTPMEEPKKVMKAEYVGSLTVARQSGMEILHGAIDDAVAANPGPWTSVYVSVAPSTIAITDATSNTQLVECRVRFLSFLGIGKNVNHCAFIMHTAQDQFVAHVLYCEPSSGALCKTIEAACKLRYQKCLDAHPSVGGVGGGMGGSARGDHAHRGGVAATLRQVFTSLAGVRGKKLVTS